MKTLNSEELDKWLFEHAQIQGHKCIGIKGYPVEHTFSDGTPATYPINIAWKDSVTDETIKILYEEEVNL